MLLVVIQWQLEVSAPSNMHVAAQHLPLPRKTNASSYAKTYVQPYASQRTAVDLLQYSLWGPCGEHCSNNAGVTNELCMGVRSAAAAPYKEITRSTRALLQLGCATHNARGPYKSLQSMSLLHQSSTDNFTQTVRVSNRQGLWCSLHGLSAETML